MLNRIKSAIYISINYYWKNLTKPDTLLASILDLRMKDLSFVSSDKCNEIKIHCMINIMKCKLIQHLNLFNQ
jgi:hypothetical protein